VVSTLLEFPTYVEMYGMFWMLEALGNSGRTSEALNIIETYYGSLLDLGATTWWETLDAHSHYGASISHGWGGAPTWFLTTYVLGARRLGANTWLVKPAFSGVRYASGSLPFQDDELQVHWERYSCGESQLELMAPVTTTGEIVLPFTNNTTVLTLNGEVIWLRGTPLVDGVTKFADGIHISLQGSNYTLEVHQDCYTVFLPLVFKKLSASCTKNLLLEEFT
jgi:alpha-L-rhamnosidase